MNTLYPITGARRRCRFRHALGYLAALCSIAMASPAFAWDEPKDFRGLTWGISSEEAEQLIRQQWKSRREAGEIIVDTEISTRHSDDRVKWFLVRDKIGGVPVSFGLYFLDDKFVFARIVFNSKDFPTIESAFKEKYGAPATDVLTPFQTGFGVRYDGRELRWSGPTLRIWVKQYDGKVTDGMASIGKVTYLDYLAEKDRLKKKDAAKDL